MATSTNGLPTTQGAAPYFGGLKGTIGGETITVTAEELLEYMQGSECFEAFMGEEEDEEARTKASLLAALWQFCFRRLRRF